MLLEEMSARSTDKQPKIKGLVKRCRSFKEDIMSRLARNRSLPKGEGDGSGRRKRGDITISGGWTSGGTSPILSDPEITDPVVLIAHRLKEAYLTLQFVESLIQKNCVDLLGGSSNVMLDLMGHLLNDIKGLTALSHTSAYQSTVSQLKSALADFLTAVDVLLLKERGDEVQKELHFEKVLDTLTATRNALARLKSLVDAKENGNHHYTNSVRHHSTSCSSGHATTTSIKPLLTSTPASRPPPLGGCSGGGITSPPPPPPPASSSDSNKRISSPPLSPIRFSDPVENCDRPIPPVRMRHRSPSSKGDAVVDADKRPPLPPKLSQSSWMAKSFDAEWPSAQHTVGASCSSSSISRTMSPPIGATASSSSSHQGGNSNVSPHHQSLLAAWLEQSTPTNTTTTTTGPHHHSHHHRSLSQHASSGGRRLHSTSSDHPSSSPRPPLHGGDDPSWTESSIYAARSCTSSSSSQLPTSSNPSLYHHHRHHVPTTRTHSDSYPHFLSDHHHQLGGSDNDSDSGSGLDPIRPRHPRDGGGGGCGDNSSTSQISLSLGSSLDNLLLVDSTSVQSGLSPGGNRISVSSNISSSGHPGNRGLASLSNYDPDVEEDVFVVAEDGEGTEPPTLPEKVNRAQFVLLTSPGSRNGGAAVSSNYSGGEASNRCPSPYENVDEADHATWHGGTSMTARDAFHQEGIKQHRNFMSYSESRNTLVGGGGGNGSGDGDDGRPPLPPKKKHSLIAAYVEFLHNFESYSQQQQQHHNHFHNHLNAIHHQHLASVAAAAAGSGGGGSEDRNNERYEQRRAFRAERSATLANPGGIGHQCSQSSSTFSFHQQIATSTSSFGVDRSRHFSEEQEMLASPLVSPTKSWGENENNDKFQSEAKFHPLSPTSSSSDKSERGNSYPGESNGQSQPPPPALPPKVGTVVGRNQHPVPMSRSPVKVVSPPIKEEPIIDVPSPVKDSTQTVGVTTPLHSGSPLVEVVSDDTPITANGDLFITDASHGLIQNEGNLHPTSNRSNSTSSSRSGGGEGPAIKGGEPHLLIVYAASPDLKDVRFREVFLLTYRTFVRPMQVVNMLWKRYQYFQTGRNASDRISLLHARATLDLWVDVVNSLTPMDLEEGMVSQLRECIYHLVSCGEIQSALKARKGLIQKYSIRVKLLCPKPPPVSLAVTTTTEPQSLLNWSATCIAQQMTLLDAELFRQLEPAELLLWAREQSEDFCPALNNFTEHFNKVSYWSRSRVLLCCSSRERNRTMKKMIEVMRKLREYNNFNSLLAVLAALDSAPIRRLGFSKRLTEALKPHAALTDSSGSFRTYRHALGESKPPCIPYIGLVLQDLTFVHIGNADLLPDGKVNWIKRWQQWVVLEPVRRFHACNYGFVRTDPLLTFLNNFDESLNDDELWQVSESIKPRSKNY